MSKTNPSPAFVINSRQLAFNALLKIEYAQAYTDIALDRVLHNQNIDRRDRSLVCQLVYGVVRHKRSLNNLIDNLGKKKAQQQPPKLLIILYLGLYQLRYLNQIPDSAVVHTSVELAKANGLNKLAGVVNGVLRNYLRQVASKEDLLKLPRDSIQRLGIVHSFPDWIVETWLEQLSLEETEQLLTWFNQTPSIDLRVNILRTSLEEVESALQEVGVISSRIPYLPQALRIKTGSGAIEKLPGYCEGWWTIQDSSAQLVTHLLDPQPGETIIDACAAPGGKTTHIAELIGDRGMIWACDRGVKRLQKVKSNAARLQLKSIQIHPGDSRDLSGLPQECDRLLLDVPCSGLGTLHKRPDIRWRQSPEKIAQLSLLQQELLEAAANCVKPQGILVYATCTINPQENEKVVQSFLESHPDWSISMATTESIDNFDISHGWMKLYPHRYDMDGFFMVRLQKAA
ncbi:MAG: 16S rRNA (cytosine(967)-C(5))-methyltransferase [Cyanobacteria bacterium P01_F01_bin.143]